MTNAANKTKETVMVGKINRLLKAEFPVHEIAKFLGIPESTVEHYKQLIDDANK